MRLRARVLIVVGVLLAAPRATADTVEREVLAMPSHHIRTTGDGELQVNGKIYAIPPLSHVLTNESWEKLDAELRRLQEQGTRLQAENESFRKSAEAWSPGWVTIFSVLAVGATLGWYAGSRL